MKKNQTDRTSQTRHVRQAGWKHITNMRRFISYIIILSMLVQNETITALAWSNPVESVDQDAEEVLIPMEENGDFSEESEATPEILSEIEDRRSEFSKEYLLSDNSRVVVVYPQQIHYETENGELAEIDNSLIKTEEGYENGNNSYEVLITDNEDSQGEVIYREDAYEIAWQMIESAGDSEEGTQESKKNAMSEARLDTVLTDEVPAEDTAQGYEGLHQPKQSKILFDGYDSGVQVEYAPLGDGIKENIILNTKESGNEYVFCVRLLGLKARLNSNNEIEFYDQDTDEIQYYFPAPFMIDREGEVSYGARYELIDNETEETEEEPGTADGTDAESGNAVMDGSDRRADAGNTATDGSDLKASAESEVTDATDPEPGVGTIDGSDLEASAESSDGINQEDSIYIRIVLDEQWLAQAAYPVTVDPVLKQARTKNLMDYGCIASNGSKYDTLYVGRSQNTIYRSFIRFNLPELEKQSVISEVRLYLDGTIDVLNTHYLQANAVSQQWYNTAEEKSGTPLSWNAQPALGDLLDYSVNAGSFNITKVVRSWQSGEKQNFGIAVTAYNEATDKRDTIRLPNNPNVPYLTITYRTATGLESYWGTHSIGAGTAGTGYINDYTGALTVVNTDVATAGKRFPMSIQHVYNSNTTDRNNGWRVNYEQTIKIPLDTLDIKTYPYVYTDEDGTEHYFKKCDVTILQNGASREVLSSTETPPAQDEDGLGLYIVPVNDTTLKAKYPLKLTDKSGSIVKYFDKMGRLAMIVDSNQYENVKNSSTKEKNCIIIDYEDYGSAIPLTAFDEAITAAQNFRNTCYASGARVDSTAYTETRDAAVDAIGRLKRDPYATADYQTAKRINTASTEMAALTDLAGTPSISTAKTRSDAILKALKNAKTQAELLAGSRAGRIRSITDAVGNKAVFTYNAQGRLDSITDPTYESGKANRYTYDSAGNLTQITFADGRKAFYTYDGAGLLTSQRDNDGYRAEYTYRATDGRIVKVAEAHDNTPGQTYGITYHADNTTAFRYSGVDDIYGNEDDLENIHVFDQQGRTICIYSKSVRENKILGATACTYEEDTDNANKRNKIKDTAVVGMHTNNLLTNHSFEYQDQTWTSYKNTNQTPEKDALNAYATTKRYIGTHGAYFNMAKRTGGTAGFKQDAKLAAGTYTLSGYCTATSIQNTAAYLKVKDAAGKVYTSSRITQATDASFDDGWERLEVTFTVNTAQTVTVYLETDCGTAKGAGTVAFDCIQLESGTVANDYNILEDGSFELTQGVLPYNWKNLSGSNVKVPDERIGGGVDGSHCYHITGQPGRDKYLKFTTNLGSTKNAYVLSGWMKADSTPVRGSRALKVTAVHKETDDEGNTTLEYKASNNINAYTEGWQYFCLLLPAHGWKSTTFTVCFYDNIGDLYIDGLQLTRNDVQTKQYNSEGKIISRYTAQKNTDYTYDSHNRTKKQTTAAGASSTYSYDTNNEVKEISANIGPNTYLKYDKYGNPVSVSAYDPDATGTRKEFHTETEYTEDGNFESASTDTAGNRTVYQYNARTGQMNQTVLPARAGEKGVEILYQYDSRRRIDKIAQGGRSVSYQYGEFDDLTDISHNGFTYHYTYDGFGNLLKISVAGTTIRTYEYAPYNGSLIKSVRADGTVTKTLQDEYGRITGKTIDGVTVGRYVYDNDGNVARYTDVAAGLTTRYDYNDSDQPVRIEVYAGENTVGVIPESRTQYTYTKSGKVGTLSYQEQGGDIKTYTHTYDKDDKPIKSILPDNSTEAWYYDSLRRNNKTVHIPKSGAADAKKLYTTCQYQASEFTADGKTKQSTTELVSRYTNKFGETGAAVSEFAYTYDAWGNITKITDLAGYERTYTYNDYGEITQAKETYAGGAMTLYTYTYNAGGNIEKENRGGKIHTYQYDSVWKDKLISYDGKAITYDAAGRPTNYMGAAMTWDKSGNLTAVKDIRYTYLTDGSRRSKTVNGKTTIYHYNNGILLSEQTGDEILRYYYDSTGKVASLSYQKGSGAETGYFFARNGQGDIIAVYRSSDSKLIGTYEYDLWGRSVSVTEAVKGIDTDGILQKNPFRFRGYYYDKETGFYYLNARYYDPEVRRFISADDMEYLGAGDSLDSYNLFIYCGNNPVMGYDPTGNWDWGGVLVGGRMMAEAAAASVALAVFGGPVSIPVVMATAGVFVAGGIVTYAAATDSVIVVDVSASGPLPIPGTYLKGGESVVIDFKNDNVNSYPHIGAGLGSSSGLSASVGVVGNYEKPSNYEGPFVGVNGGYWLGIDHCWDPRKEHDLATQATSVTFSDGFGGGLEGSIFGQAIQIFEW